MSTSTDEFANPATAVGVQWEELKGSLLLFEVLGQEKEVKTVHGTADPIRADLAILDGPQAGETFNDTLVFPRVLVSQLRPSIGKKVLGRLTQGEKKPGQNPPWKLAEPTEQDKTIARAYVAKNAPPPF